MRGSRDICYRYYTRFSHRARDDVWPGAVDSTQAATSLPDSIVGRRMACQSDIHEAALKGGGVTVGRGNLPGSDFESPCYGEQTAAARRGIAATSPTGYWVGAERDLGCKNLGPQSVSSCRPKSLHDCDRRPVTILGSGPLTDSAARHSGVSNRVLGGCRAGLGVQKPRAAKRLVLPVKVLTRLRLETGNDPRIGSSNG